MKRNEKAAVARLLRFIDDSPTPFHAAANLASELESAGYLRLTEQEPWNLVPGGKYYVTRNGTSLIALHLPKGEPTGFSCAASHTDSPGFRLKPNWELEAFGTYLRLDTEVYGGTILNSWMDRPLAVAGRVVVKQPADTHAPAEVFAQRLVDTESPVALIPNVAIHFNRQVNNGVAVNPAVDTVPLVSTLKNRNALREILKKQAGGEILSGDLCVYNAEKGFVWGSAGEFFSAPRIDDLECAWTTLRGFLAVEEPKNVAVYAAFDNEEVGSGTKQGAGSDFLLVTLRTVAAALGRELRQMLACSFLLSADNAHARHPNHPELSDGENAPHMGGGLVFKRNASQKYATEAVSAALVQELCRRGGVPVQHFANRSDIAGGGTLGSISDTRVPMLTADVGLAQLAMHSAMETAGCADVLSMENCARMVFSSRLVWTDREGSFRLDTD